MTIVIIMTIILSMNSSKNKNLIFVTVGCISLLIGLLIYLIFRENTIVSRFVSSFVDLTILRNAFFWAENDFLKYYFADYLWALSLACGLHIIFVPKIKGSFLCAVTVLLFGAFFEIMQYFGIVNGTGDFLDVISYLLAALTVNIINLKRGK